MHDVTTLADLLQVMAKCNLADCRIFTTYDGGLSPFAAIRAEPSGAGDVVLHFDACEHERFDGALTTTEALFKLAGELRLNPRQCRLFATIDGDDTILAACAASVFNGADIHFSFMPATAALPLADVAGRDGVSAPFHSGLVLAA